MEEVYEIVIEYLKTLPKQKQEMFIRYFRTIGVNEAYDNHSRKVALDINEAHIPKIDQTRLAIRLFCKLLKNMSCEKIALELENIINS